MQLAGLLSPIVAEQKRLLLGEPLLQADETPVPHQDSMRKGKLSQGYLWAYTKPWAEVVFDFTPTRSREAPRAFLTGFAGHLQTDGYVGYSSLFENRADTRIGCLAHVRRKFFEARHESESAATAIAAIQQIYRTERRCRDEDIRGPDLVDVRRCEWWPLPRLVWGGRLKSLSSSSRSRQTTDELGGLRDRQSLYAQARGRD